MICQYYQAEILTKKAWFVSGCFRNEDHVAFARALDGSSTVFEFFVPSDQESKFLVLAHYLKDKGFLLSLENKENRFKPLLD